MDVDYRAVEHELCRIPEVAAARILTPDGDRPPEVHIVASPDRQPGQVARDVQSVALAAFGLQLDHRAISVVQVEDGARANGACGPAEAEAGAGATTAGATTAGATTAGAPVPAMSRSGDGGLPPVDLRRPAPTPARAAEPAASPDVITVHAAPEDTRTPSTGTNGSGPLPRLSQRVVVDRVLLTSTGHRGSAEVGLLLGPSSALGQATGTAAQSSMRRAVASATLDALGQLEPAAVRADVVSATVVRSGDHLVAVVTVVVVLPPYEEVMAGAAVVRSTGEPDAIARAVLHAMNRRVTVLPVS